MRPRCRLLRFGPVDMRLHALRRGDVTGAICRCSRTASVRTRSPSMAAVLWQSHSALPPPDLCLVALPEEDECDGDEPEAQGHALTFRRERTECGKRKEM